MTKMIKMSLIAATAVAGLTTTSSAVALEEAIKNTDLSGYIRYRYTNGESTQETNAYKTVFKIKSKVNDNVNAFVKIGGEAKTGDNTTDADAAGDHDPDQTAIKEVNFQYSGNGLTVIAGKQGLQTPFADLADQQGTGIVALYPVGGVTLAFGHYLNSDGKSIYSSTLNATENDIGGNNITAIAAIGAAGPVNYAAWYANIAEQSIQVGDAYSDADKAGATAINLNVSAKVGPATVEFNHASVNYSLTDTLKANNRLGAGTGTVDELNPTQTRVVASAAAGPANVTVGYVMTGDEGGNVTLGDTDAKANFVLESISASALADASIMYVGANAKVAGMTVGLEYLTGDGKEVSLVGKETKGSWTKADVAEIKLSVAYAMSKNFKVSGFITDAEYADKTAGVKAVSKDLTRIEIKYTF